MLPAYAGMIPPSRSPGAARICAPRVCGDDPTILAENIAKAQCSPRMRG